LAARPGKIHKPRWAFPYQFSQPVVYGFPGPSRAKRRPAPAAPGKWTSSPRIFGGLVTYRAQSPPLPLQGFFSRRSLSEEPGTVGEANLFLVGRPIKQAAQVPLVHVSRALGRWSDGRTLPSKVLWGRKNFRPTRALVPSSLGPRCAQDPPAVPRPKDRGRIRIGLRVFRGPLFLVARRVNCPRSPLGPWGAGPLLGLPTLPFGRPGPWSAQPKGSIRPAEAEPNSLGAHRVSGPATSRPFHSSLPRPPTTIKGPARTHFESGRRPPPMSVDQGRWFRRCDLSPSFLPSEFSALETSLYRNTSLGRRMVPLKRGRAVHRTLEDGWFPWSGQVQHRISWAGPRRP